MDKDCYTCGAKIDTPLEKKCAKSLQSNFRHSDEKVAYTLKRAGWKIGIEKNWDLGTMCRKCWTLLNKWATQERKILQTSSDWFARTGHKLPTIQKRIVGPAFKQRAMAYIRHSEYRSAFNLVRKHSKGAKKAWEKAIKENIRKEMRALDKEKDLFSGGRKGKDLAHFDWKTVLLRVKKVAPTVYTVIEAAITKNDKDRCMKQSSTRAKLGTMLLIPLFHRQPRACRQLPLAIATALWKLGTTGKVIKFLHKLGISQTPESVRRYVDGLVKDNQLNLNTWKVMIQDLNPQPILTDEEVIIHPGYALCVGNLQWSHPTQQHPAPNSKPKVKVQSVAYAIRNRVSCRPLTDPTTVRARDLPLSVFLPSQDDYDRLRQRMEVIVQRMLLQLLSYFKDVPREAVPEHFPHEYTEASAFESTFINVGILEPNPTNVDGMTDLLKSLHKHVPVQGTGLYRIALHGTSPIVEVAAQAQHTCNLDAELKTKPSGLAPVPQEFHFRAQVLQDTWDEFLKPTKKDERGTLKQLTAYFKHKGDSYNIIKNGTNNFDFMQMLTTSLVTGFATNVMQISSIGDDAPLMDQTRSKEEQLRDVAVEIVRRVWHQVPMTSVSSLVAASHTQKDKFCHCQRDIEGAPLIECSNPTCQNGKYFHTECVMLEAYDPEMDWFCSAECQVLGNSSFCVCRRKIPHTPMLKCQNDTCERGVYFHHKCVRIERREGIDGEWYCSTECRREAGHTDYLADNKLKYMEALAWRGLLQECLRDAEREGDGESMMRHWRIYLPEMWNRSHTRYLASAHRLLAGVSGCLPARLRSEIVHNRTINIEGGAGNNLAIDLFIDMMTKEFRDSVSSGHQEFSPKLVSRANAVVSCIGPRSERLQGLPSTTSKFLSRYESSNDYSSYKDVSSRFLKDFAQDHLFDEMQGRRFESIPDYSYKNGTNLVSPEILRERLVKLSEEYSELQTVNEMLT